MKHPQTYSKELNQKIKCSLTPERLESIEKYGCCAFVLLWTLGIEPDDDFIAIMTVSDMIEDGVIGKDCTVKWAEAILYLTGRNATVEFADIKSIKSIKERTPVRYDYNGKSHWVGVQNGKIEFNPLKNSVCVENGKPVTCRKIKILRSQE